MTSSALLGGQTFVGGEGAQIDLRRPHADLIAIIETSPAVDEKIAKILWMTMMVQRSLERGVVGGTC